MRVDVSSMKALTAEPPPNTMKAIEEFKAPCSEEEFIAKLAAMNEWNSMIGKTEMLRWVDVLDRMDEILERATTLNAQQCYAVDIDNDLRQSVFTILKFTNLLFENTSTRSIYASTDRLLVLLQVDTFNVVISTLQLFQCISKRSHFLRAKMPGIQQTRFQRILTAIAQSWYSRVRAIKMKQVIEEKLTVPEVWPFEYRGLSASPNSPRWLNFEKPEEGQSITSMISKIATNGEELEQLLLDDNLRARLRVARNFASEPGRINCVSSRLLAISTLIYSRLLCDEMENIFTRDLFIEECAEVAKLSDYPENIAEYVNEMRSEALRTLTSIAAQEKPLRLQKVIESLGANSYHGFLSVLARKCVNDLRSGKVSVQLCTALFSLLYHISSLEQGSESIVSCGLMQTLLSVVSCTTLPLSQISFVTRCVRVIDLITTYEVASFRQSNGLEVSIDRLVHEVEECRKEQPFVIDESLDREDNSGVSEYIFRTPCEKPCNQQRSALIKSLLNFLKRTIQDNNFTDQIRQMMNGNLPKALIHLISNADYYTATLFQNSIQLVSNFICHEPQQLTSLQQMHLPFVILHALLRKEIPTSKDVINNMIATFQALCLNARGLEQLKAYEPFDHIFKIILSLKFITAMKKKRNDMNDVAVGIGGSLEDLMRQHQELRPLMVNAVIRALENLKEISVQRGPQVVMTLSRQHKGPRNSRLMRHPLIREFNLSMDDARLINILHPHIAPSPQREEESEDEDEAEAESDTNQEADDAARDPDMETETEPSNTAATSEPVQMDTTSAPSTSADIDKSALLGLQIDTLTPDGHRVVPLGEYLLVFFKIVETLITQTTPPDFINGLVAKGFVPQLLAVSQLLPIRIQLTHSTIPSNVANILKYTVQVSTDEELLPSILRELKKIIDPLLALKTPENWVGVISSLSHAAACDTIGMISYVTQIVSILSKSAQSSVEETRNKILKAWVSPTGIEFVEALNAVSKLISRDLAISHAVFESSKVTTATQTDSPIDEGEAKDSGNATTSQTSPMEMSVETEAAPPTIPSWQTIGIGKEEYGFWQKNKDVYNLLSKAEKSLNDFPVQLTRGCLKPQRTRRGFEQPAREVSMSEAAKKLAEMGFRMIANNIKSTFDECSMLINFYGDGLLEQISAILFNDRTQASLPLLGVFYKSGCHRAFCQMLVRTIAPQFEKATLNSGDLKVLTVTWMKLADRLVNRNNMAPSRTRVHQPATDSLNFPPEKYYRLLLTDLFAVFNQLFATLRSDAVDLKAHMASAERSITVYKEVVRNLVELRDEGSQSTAARMSDVDAAAEQVDGNHLQMLLDMGFARAEIVQALVDYPSVVDATEYLISNQSDRQNTEAGTPAPEPKPDATPKAEIKRAPSEDEPPLSELKLELNVKAAVSSTCNEMVPLCNRLMDVDAGSELVYSSADLVIGVIDSTDPNWRVQGLIRAGMCDEILSLATALQKNPACRKSAKSLSTRLHFACLLWSHVAEEYLEVLKGHDLVGTLIDLAVTLTSKDSIGDAHLDFHFQEKGVVGSLLLWLDLFTNCSRMSMRRQLLKSVLGDGENPHTLNFSYYQYEERFGARGRVVAIEAPTKTVIHKAFVDGKSKVSFKMDRKEYHLSFADMTMKVEGGNTTDKNLVFVDLPSACNVDMDQILGEEKTPIWSETQMAYLLCSIIGIIKKRDVHHSVAHSVLQLLTRITADPTIAHGFFAQGGLRDLLQLRCLSTPSTSGLLTLVVRNCIDNQTLLAPVYERSVRSVAGGTHANGHATIARWNPARNGQMRDWRSALNTLQPLLIKDPELFERTMESLTKIDDGKLSLQQIHQNTGVSAATGSNNPSTSAESGSKANSHHIPTGSNTIITQIIELLLSEVLSGTWDKDENATDIPRMVTKANLLTIVSELVRGYSCVAHILCDLKAEGSATHTILYPLIDTLVGETKDMETHNAVRTLVATISSCNFATKAMDALVTEVKAVITDLPTKNYEQQLLLSKVSELANLIILMREACPTIPLKGPANAREASNNTMVRLLYKKRICNELTRALILLPLGKKECVDAVNNVLRTLDEVSRSIHAQVSQPNAKSDKSGEDAVTVHDVSFSVAPDAATQPEFDIVHDDYTIGEVESESDEEDDHIFEEDDDDEGDEGPVGGDSDDDTQRSEEDTHNERMDEEEEEAEDPDVTIDERALEHPPSPDRLAAGQAEDQPMPEAVENDVLVVDDEEVEPHEENVENDVEEEEPSDMDDDEDDEDDYPEDIIHRLYDEDFGREWAPWEGVFRDQMDIDGIGGFPMLHGPPHRLNNPSNRAQDHPLLTRPTAVPVEPARANVTDRIAQRLNHIERLIPRFAGGNLQRGNALRHRIDPMLMEDMRTLGLRPMFETRMLERPLFAMVTGHGGHADGFLTPTGVNGGDRRWAHASTALERLADGVRLLEPLSAQYLAVLVNAIIVRKADAKGKADKQAKAANEKKGDEVLGLAQLVQEAVAPVEEEAMDTQEVPVVTAVVDTEAAETSAVDQPLPSEVVDQDVPMESPPIEPAPQAMEVSSEPPVDAAAPVDRPPATTPTPHDDEEPMQEDPPATPTPEQSDSDGPVDVEATTPSTTDEPPAGTGMIRVPEEYRHILGDIEIPEGVDVEFIAALPEELRQEVLRDHERQQRAQRAAQAPPPAVAAAAVETGGIAPVDQEFLAALPPEIQEEILAQHERAVRNAQAAANPPANPPPVDNTDHAVAFLESLGPGLRSQILSDADDSMLAILPTAVAEEARRLRARYEQERLVRIQQRLIPAGGPARRHIIPGRLGHPMVPGNAQPPNEARTADSNAVQILDRDALVVLASLFFIDNPRFSTNRLYKVVRSLCSHPATCDFFVWSMLSLLEKMLNACDEDEQAPSNTAEAWTDTFSYSGGTDPALRMAADGSSVWVHPQAAPVVAKCILEALINLSKALPGHFLSTQLRSDCKAQATVSDVPLASKFWKIVAELGQKKFHGKEPQLNEFRYAQLEHSPLSYLLQMLESPVAMSNVELQGKLLKTCAQVFNTLPNDTSARLSSTKSASLSSQLATVVRLVTEAKWANETLQDARTILVDAIRALGPSTTTFIFDQLYKNIEKQARLLIPQISLLVTQLTTVKPSSETEATPETDSPETSKAVLNRGVRVQVNRYDGDRVVVEGDTTGRSLAAASSCIELQLPAVSALTDKTGAQYSLLQGLQTVCKIRDLLRVLRTKRQEEAEARKKKEEEERKKKEADEKKQKEETETDGKDAGNQDGTDAGAPTSAAAEATPAPRVVQPEAAERPSTSGTAPADLTATEPAPMLEIFEIDERLSSRLESIHTLWPLVSTCLERLGRASDPHAVLALQPVAEAFFLVHAVHSSNPANDHEHPDTKNLVQFAEQHRSVLNQVLRQDPSALADGGPFTVLTQFPKLLDFDVKRKYFRKQLAKGEDPRAYRRDDVAIRVRRSQIFSESYRELFRLSPADWKHRFYIVFDGEEGQDAGGLLREWFSVITREIFNPDYALFITSPGDRVTYMINRASWVNPEHLDYFKFVGRIIAKAVHDNKLLDCYFTRAFYKHILNLPVRYQDLESEDPSFYNSLRYILDNPIDNLSLDLNFTLEVTEFGVTESRDLKEGGSGIPVTDENKEEYVKLVCQMKMTSAVQKQLKAFLDGFYDIIPKTLISMFNEQELELLISGLPEVDIDDLSANTEYRVYTKTSPQIQWFWRALRSFDSEDRAKFLQFVTGTSKVPLQGFASLEGMNGVQKFSIHMDSRSGDRLPAAHTCFNQLDLPTYDSYEKLRQHLLTAIRECTEGFGFA